MLRKLWPGFLVLPATATLYLGYVRSLGSEIGFPVDDSWIHQTFARNLVQLGELAYNPGEPSTGSTSPLWTLLLAVAYIFPVDFRFWAYFLGLFFLGLTSWVGYLLCRRLFPSRPWLASIAALAILLESRLNWAALSGMETLFFAFSCLLLIYLSIVAVEEGLSRSLACLVGLAAALATLVRPEGVALAILAFAVIALCQKSRSSLAISLGIWVVLLIPLVAYYFSVDGTPLPSTFYAKHAAYSQSPSLGFVVSYLIGAAGTLAEGPLLVLLPGVIYLAFRIARPPAARTVLSFRQVAPFALIGFWVAGLIGLYMVRLPALFHHGRYLMPLIPLLIVVGLGGLAEAGERIPFRLLTKVYAAIILLVFLVLWANGAVVYGWDVKFINDEEVRTATWLGANTSPAALIATHDIGAVGYFSGRRIVDTAGLVTPELGPYVREEAKILDYLERRKVDYLAVFPKWYPNIVADSRFEEVSRIDEAYVIPDADNMVVYRIRW